MVHVVPAFPPYYAPQAEANNVVPVRCVARNVACNVRGVNEIPQATEADTNIIEPSEDKDLSDGMEDKKGKKRGSKNKGSTNRTSLVTERHD